MLKGICYFHSETGTEGGYWAFQDSRHISSEGWSYDGLHILEDGDSLTIFSPDDPSQIVWSGTISLHQYPSSIESVSGFWIHADQRGVDREIWARYFFDEYPAELVPVRKP
ncbi:MAG: hypothetical protein Q8O87_00105 [bacterium]|nr:hypothetical protein [bacterium]